MIVPLALVAAAVLLGTIKLAFWSLDALVRRPRLGLVLLVLFALSWAESRHARWVRAHPRAPAAAPGACGRGAEADGSGKRR